MASSRETLINLIVEKTDMNEAEANSYLGEIVESIDESSIKTFYEEMIKQIGKSNVQKINGNSLSEIVQGIVKNPTIYTKQRKKDEDASRAEKQAKDVATLSSNLKGDKIQDENKTKEASPITFEDFTKYVNEIPKEILEPNIGEIKKISEELMTQMPDAPKDVIDNIASAMEDVKRKKALEEYLKSDENIKGPEEKQKCMDAFVIQNDLRDIFGDKKYTQKQVEIVSSAAYEARKLVRKYSRAEMDEVQIEILGKICRLEMIEKEIAALVERHPEDKTYAEHLVDVRKKLDTTRKSFKTYGKYKEIQGKDISKEDYIDSKNGILNVNGRIKKLNLRKIEIEQEKKKLENEFAQETNPQKKAELRARIIEKATEGRNTKNEITFEILYGQHLDTFMKTQIISKRHGTLNEETMKTAFKGLHSRCNEEKKDIIELRKRLENPGITPQEREDVLLAISTVEKNFREKMSIVGLGQNEARNALWEAKPLRTSEFMELEASRIKNDTRFSNEQKERKMNSLKSTQKSLRGFEEAIGNLSNKGYSSDEIIILLSSIQVIRDTDQLPIGDVDVNEYFQQRVSTKNVSQDLIKDFLKEYEGKEKELRHILRSPYPAYVSTIAETKEMYIEKHKAEHDNGMVNNSQEKYKERLRGIVTRVTEGQVFNSLNSIKRDSSLARNIDKDTQIKDEDQPEIET